MTKLFEYREYKNTEDPVPFCWKVLATLFTASVFLAMAVVCGSCQSDEIGTEVVVEEGQPATLRLEVVAEEQMDVATRAVVEDKINNLHVLVYNSKGDLIGQKYQTGSPSTVTVNTVTATGCTVYAIANTGKADLFSGYDIHKESYLKEMARTVSAWNTLTTANDVPMTGSKSKVDITASTSLPMTLTRMVAKVTLNIDIEPNSGITISDYTLCNLPKKGYYVPRPTSTEADDKDTNNTAAGDDAASAVIDYWATGDKISVNSTVANATYYMFENRRGVNTKITTQDKKIAANAPANATYVKINGTVKGNLVTWIVYLGANEINNFNIKRNCTYTYNIKLKVNGMADSRVTIDTTGIIDLSKDGKANCYLAAADSHWYSFDATVRGNGETEDYAKQQYPNLDISISLMPPKISGSADAVTIPKAKVKDAVVVWETDKGLINWVIWDSNTGSVKFKTGTAKGNAVIAVRDASGKILWSWHIWRTDGVDLSALNANGSKHIVKVTTNTNRQWYKNLMNRTDVGRTRTITMLQCNLGAQLNDACSYNLPAGNIGKYGLQYQFGRKDPFPGAASYTASGSKDDYGNDIFSEFTVYGYGSSTSYNSTGFTIGSRMQPASIAYGTHAQESLKYVIEHPDIYLYGTKMESGKNWIDNAVVNTAPWTISRCLWGDNNTATVYVNDGGLDPDPWGTPNEYGKKTIYDPCPAGWRVAAADSWTGIANSTPQGWSNIAVGNIFHGSFNKGYVFHFGSSTGVSTYCPAIGMRDASSGSLVLVGTLGSVWWSSPSSVYAPSTTYFYSKSDMVQLASDYAPALAFPIRCAKIE